MTIDEMISWIDVNGKNFTADNISPEAQAIIAALRAGQLMRSYLSVKSISDGQVVATIRSGYAGNLAKTLQAFDAETGGAK